MQSDITSETKKNYDTGFCIICENCDSKENNKIILCDHCNRGFHMMCINLTILPKGN